MASFTSMPMPRRDPIPVTVLTGFLGSGKTTLVNHILNDQTHGMRFAIIENEIGAVGVDNKILDLPKANIEDEMLEVINGCICCKVRGDLVTALKRLYNKVHKFDGVIIETTGLADPAPVAQTFFQEEGISVLYKLDCICAVVDAKHVEQHLDDKNKKPKGFQNETEEQLAFADVVLLNKTDLVADPPALDALEKRIKTINHGAPIYRTEQSKVDPKKLLNVGAFDLERVLEMDPEFLNPHGHFRHDKTVSSHSVKFEGDLNVSRMQRWLRQLISQKSDDLFRYKGVLSVNNMPQKFVFQGVHMMMVADYFPDMQWALGEPRDCRLVFIGRDLDKAELTKQAMDCKAEEQLRFKIGDIVEAKTGTNRWEQGRVIKIWDQGHPYRIEVLDSGKNVWGPEDRDICVRAVLECAELTAQ